LTDPRVRVYSAAKVLDELAASVERKLQTLLCIHDFLAEDLVKDRSGQASAFVDYEDNQMLTIGLYVQVDGFVLREIQRVA
jgi:hypothetical protein